MAKIISPLSAQISQSLCLLLLLFFSFPAKIDSQAATTSEEEKKILLQIKREWTNPSSLSSWNDSSSSSHCQWKGIQCTDGSVTAISLDSQDIDGEIPAVTCNLKNLSVLILSNNLVGGDFPTVLYNCSNLQILNLSQNVFVGEIPADVYRLSSTLRLLNLSANNFSGDVPPSIGRFPQLQMLDLDNNLFKGTFPKELGNISTLERLTLANNPFTPMKLPAEFGNLTKLKHLWMSEARLVGEIPETFGNLTDLEHLDLAMNELSGTIPGGIWNLKKLKMLYLYENKLSGEIERTIGALGLMRIDLSKNALSGSIPGDFGKLQNLSVLFLYDNQLSGEIPVSIARIPTLSDIRLFNNSLTGVLPPELGLYSRLHNFEVVGNRISGELPENLCAGGALNSLVVAENNLTGKLPESLGYCRTLTNIQVYKNGFLGDVPARIWSLVNLGTVIIHDNALFGELPDRLPWNLSRLEIGNNRFSGKIPSSSRNLRVFKASNNLFSGKIPSDLTEMSLLQELVLDRNQISGEIPPQIKSLSYLTNLNLSNNQLMGGIPRAIGSLPVLNSLDLSENRLSGEIPKEMGELRLNFLNLSSNSLTGRIPSPLQNLAYDQSFLSNPGLCSSNIILNLPSCDAKPNSSHELPKGLLALFLVLGILVFFVVVFFGCFVVKDLRKKKSGGDIASWKLTSFHSLDFTESNIVRSLAPENLIGSGGSGQVYRIPIGNRVGEVVAVKKIWNSKKLDSKLEKEFQAEVEILGSIRHSNIVKLLCCISSVDSKLLVYEYMENGSLDRWLHGKKSIAATGGPPMDRTGSGRQGPLDWPTRMGIAVGAAQGLCYMHHDNSPPIVHRDVKASNILLDSEFKPKVADFGLARMLVKAGEPDTVSAVAGSFGYMAPESAYSRKVNEKVDVYSFGVVLLELVTGKQANQGDEHSCLAEWAWRHFQEGKSVVDAIDDQIRDHPSYFDEMSVVLRLGLICTGTLPSTRPSMKEVLQVLLRCAHTNGFGDKSGREYDVAPLLPTIRKNSRRKGLSDDDEESSLACNV